MSDKIRKSKYYTNKPSIPPLGHDAYELAQRWNCTPDEAAQRARRELYFAGYNDCGQESWSVE